MTMLEIKKELKARGVKGISNKNKAELLDMLLDARGQEKITLGKDKTDVKALTEEVLRLLLKKDNACATYVDASNPFYNLIHFKPQLLLTAPVEVDVEADTDADTCIIIADIKVLTLEEYERYVEVNVSDELAYERLLETYIQDVGECWDNLF